MSEPDDVGNHRIKWAATIIGASIVHNIVMFVFGMLLGVSDYSTAALMIQSPMMTVISAFIAVAVLYIALDYAMFDQEDNFVHKLWITFISAFFGILIMIAAVYHVFRKIISA